MSMNGTKRRKQKEVAMKKTSKHDRVDGKAIITQSAYHRGRMPQTLINELQESETEKYSIPEFTFRLLFP